MTAIVSQVAQQLRDARGHLERGDLKQALAICRPLLGSMPLEPDVCSLAGAALLGLGRALQALRVIAPACEASPERADLQLLRVSCLLEGGRFAQATRGAEALLRTTPGSAPLLAAIGEAGARSAELEGLVRSSRRPLLTDAQRATLRQDFRSNYRSVPVVINSRDRRTCLEQLIAWLRSAGYTNLIILDNASTHAGLLEYLRGPGDEVIVYRLTRNLGPRALWSSGLINLLGDVPFVYSDPDVVPTEDCPADAILVLWDLLQRYRQATKAGLGIRIDDIPDRYERKATVQSWEQQFWSKPLDGNCYDAPVDTTFALYRAGSWHDFLAIRSGSPYLARHLQWYADSASPTAEDRYYEDHAVAHMSTWGTREILDMYTANAAGL